MTHKQSRPWKVLVVDDEREIRGLLCLLLRREGFEPIEAPSGPEALRLLREDFPDVVLLDVHMPEMNGMTVLKEAKKFDVNTPILLVTGHGSIGSAVEAVKNGAYDYVTKPFRNDELILKVRRALETRTLRQENLALRSRIDDQCDLQERMGSSEAIARIYADIDRVAPTDFTVVISGETGSGKELVARAIHRRSRRHEAAFVPVDGGAVQPGLIESELFGHEKGSFTGADRTHAGKFEAAAGGTLFLDEIQNLPMAVQNKLLRALQEKQIVHVGGTKPIDIDIRVVVATNVNLEAQVAQGAFRQDLYHRLNEFHIVVPPLRERRDDLLYLAKRFIDLTSQELDKDIQGITGAAVEMLLAYRWPGNVRQLRNVIRRAVLMADTHLDIQHLDLGGGGCEAGQGFPQSCDGPATEIRPFKEMVRPFVMRAEREVIRQALARTNGNMAKAARLLEIDYKTIRKKAKLYGVPMNFDSLESAQPNGELASLVSNGSTRP